MRGILTQQGWGLLSQFPPFRYFPNFLALPKYVLTIKYHIYIWQVAPVKYKCDSSSLRGTFTRSKMLLTEKLTNGAWVTPTPGPITLDVSITWNLYVLNYIHQHVLNIRLNCRLLWHRVTPPHIDWLIMTECPKWFLLTLIHIARLSSGSCPVGSDMLYIPPHLWQPGSYPLSSMIEISRQASLFGNVDWLDKMQRF